MTAIDPQPAVTRLAQDLGATLSTLDPSLVFRSCKELACREPRLVEGTIRQPS